MTHAAERRTLVEEALPGRRGALAVQLRCVAVDLAAQSRCRRKRVAVFILPGSCSRACGVSAISSLHSHTRAAVFVVTKE